MANKTIKLAAIAASVFAAMTANAATLKVDVGSGADSGTLSVEGSTRSAGVDVPLAANGALVLTGANYADNDIVTFTLTGGTWKDRADYALVASVANTDHFVGGSLLSGSDNSVVAFRLASGSLAKGLEFYLSGSSAASTVVPTVNVKNIASGGVVTLNYDVKSGFGQGIDSISKATTIFNGIREYYASVLTKYDASISLNNQRKNFGGTTTPVLTDTLGLRVEQDHNPTFGDVVLDADDKLDITITGDMTGIDNIKLATKSFSISGNAASLSGASLQDALNSSTGVAATNKLLAVAKVKGDTELAARSFTTSVTINFDEESNQQLVNNASAGAWTVDQLNAVVSNMTLNASGFVSWLKVVNESVVDGTLNAVATWTEVDGATTTTGQTASVVLGTAKSKAVTTIGEADILKAIGKDSAKGILDVSLNITVDAPKEELHIVAEKKASDGRVTTPVYYKERKLGQ